MTIEERIGLCRHCLTDETRLCHTDCHLYTKYKGATEQKSIDEEIYTEEMRKLNEEWKENLAFQRYLFTEKACKWLKKELKKLAMNKIDDNFLDNEFKVVLKSDIPKWLDNFRKALEDK